MKWKKEQRGITLIALIITIIILILLVAITINKIIESKLIEIATEGVITYANLQAKEEIETEQLDENINSTVEKIKNIENQNTISITSVTYIDKTTSEIIAEISAKDKENGNLDYTIYTKTEETEWVINGNETNKKSGEIVTIKANGLEPYQEYYWKIRVTNSKDAIETPVQEMVRTYCTGKGVTCLGYSKIDCELCNATGKNVCGKTLYLNRDYLGKGTYVGVAKCTSCRTSIGNSRYILRYNCNECTSGYVFQTTVQVCGNCITNYVKNLENTYSDTSYESNFCHLCEGKKFTRDVCEHRKNRKA